MGNFYSNKRGNFIFIAAILVMAVSCFGPAICQDTGGEEVLDWNKVTSAFEAYVDYPSLENARALLEALPKDRPYKVVNFDDGITYRFFDSEESLILYEEFISGDRLAVEIYFRMLNVADGAFMTMQLDSLGWLARDKPGLFLDVLMQYKDMKAVKRHGYVVAGVGFGHMVHQKAKMYILEKRMEALASVEDEKYAALKEACIKNIRERIEEAKKLINRPDWADHQEMSEEKAIDWDKALAAFSAYVDYPTSENGWMLVEALPKETIKSMNYTIKRTIESRFFRNEDPLVLYEEFISGERNAVEIYFRLLNIAVALYDKYYLEAKLSSLGWLARDKPRLFLDVLIKYKDMSVVKMYDYAVTTVSSGHEKHPKAAIHILEKRLEALETVKDPDYEEVKAICQDKIRNKIEELKKRIR